MQGFHKACRLIRAESSRQATPNRIVTLRAEIYANEAQPIQIGSFTRRSFKHQCLVSLNNATNGRTPVNKKSTSDSIFSGKPMAGCSDRSKKGTHGNLSMSRALAQNERFSPKECPPLGVP